MAATPGGGDFVAKAGEHLRSRALDRLAADDRADGDAAGAALGDGLAHAGDGEDGSDADEGVTGGDDEPVRDADGVEDAGGRGRPRPAPAKRMPVTSGSVASRTM